MQLNFKKVGEGEPLIILHGLFGSLDNWLTLSKKLGENFEVFIVDARNHGLSPHSDEFTYDVMADDLYEFLIQNNIKNPTVLGHSMGGKTAMHFAMKYPNYLSKLIVVDIAPKAYPVHHTQILEAMLSVDFNTIKTRKSADEYLSKTITDFPMRQFLLKNLYWTNTTTLAWKFNLSVINKDIELMGIELKNTKVFEKPTLFIRGVQSDYILEEDTIPIKNIFTKAEIKSMNNGHWLHAENPIEFLQIVNSFLLSN
jgi:pimeloyl-ACP methyl ester carboxylesterase